MPLYSVHRNHVEWLCGITPTRTMNARGHINSVPWMTAVTSTPYHEWPRSHQLRTMNDRGHTNSVPWMHAVCRLPKATFIQTNFVHSWYGVGVTAFIHGTELMRFGKVALRRTKISMKWLWPVKVTLEVIKRRTIVFCWSCDEGHLKWDKKIFPSLQFTNTDRISILSTPPPNGRSMPLRPRTFCRRDLACHFVKSEYFTCYMINSPRVPLVLYNAV